MRSTFEETLLFVFLFIFDKTVRKLDSMTDERNGRKHRVVYR